MESQRTRSLVMHHDDVGGNHSTNAAFVELFDLGVITCGSVMVPVPWFSEIARIVQERPDLDLGVHLTLNAEFTTFRWRPITYAPTLVDEDGFFWTDIPEARSASVDEVRGEMRRQIELAYNAGIDVTHLDSHCGTIWQPEFIDVYLDLGREYDLPITLTKDVAGMSAPHENLDEKFETLRERRNPDFHRFLTTPFETGFPTLDCYADILTEAQPGLNWCGFHCAKPGDIEYVTPDSAVRIAEYELFTSDEFRKYLREEQFELVGMRALRDQMRGHHP